MAEKQKSETTPKKALNWKATLAICLLLFLAAGGVAFWVYSTEPKAKRSGTSRETAMLVNTVGVQSGTFRPTLVELGRVEPSRDIEISPRISGEVIEMSPNFKPGGFVEKSEVLLRIDPADYEVALAQREGDLHLAKADLEVEMGRQKVAELDYELFEQELAIDDKSLILREPQLNAARAEVESAQAAVRRARLDLERTILRAPFDGQVLSREVNLGSQVAQGTNLGRLVGIDTYWVVATVPLNKLDRIEFPNSDGKGGSPARVRNRSAWPKDIYREGQVETLLGTLDDQTRLARILITIQDPLTRRQSEGPPLIAGSVLQVEIEGIPLENVVRLDRPYLRKNDTVWVMEEGKLEIKEVDVAFRDADYVYLTSGLAPEAQVVTTNLATVVEGAPLRKETEGAGESPR